MSVECQKPVSLGALAKKLSEPQHFEKLKQYADQYRSCCSSDQCP